MYNFVEEHLFSLLILDIYPCITDGLGKLLCKLYIITCDFSFLPQLCYDSATIMKQTAAYWKQLLAVENWMVKYGKATPNFGVCPVVGQVV